MLESFSFFFIKKRLKHRYFPVNFEKCLRISILQNTSGRLFLLDYLLSPLISITYFQHSHILLKTFFMAPNITLHQKRKLKNLETKTRKRYLRWSSFLKKLRQSTATHVVSLYSVLMFSTVLAQFLLGA